MQRSHQLTWQLCKPHRLLADAPTNMIYIQLAGHSPLNHASRRSTHLFSFPPTDSPPGPPIHPQKVQRLSVLHHRIQTCIEAMEPSPR
jgi:hypothetical protein